MDIKLKALRTAKGITQTQLSKILGIAQGTLSGWENGKYEIDNENLIKLVNYFNVSIDYLLGVSDIKEKNQINTTEDKQKGKLLKNYAILNKEGKKKLIDYSDDLFYSGRYQKTNNYDINN